MDNTILELKDIVKTFPGVLALNGLKFNLRSGEVHAICGENGAGKSTLMKVVCGVHQPDEGEMYVNGEQVNYCNPLEAYKKGVSIIFQETSLFEDMTVLDNMFLGHEIIKERLGIKVIDYAQMKKKAKSIFQKLNTNIDLDASIKSLGMAQKQMVEIAKALTFDANIIIFDEPTASLTHREVDALFKIINTLRAEGRGIVYISHRIEEIFQICNRVTIVRDGQYIDTKDISETNKDEIVRLMVGREMTNYYPKTETVLGKEIFKVEHYYDEGFLEDVNFYVREGEILGFAGLAGAGRTELMQSICGFTGKAAGRVIMNGKDIDIRNYNDAKSSGIVYVSEDRGKYGLIVDMSIEQNITLPQLKEFANKLSLIEVDKESKVADQYRKDIGIKAPDSKFLVANLSGGNQQKVAVSKALALKPKLLILDEPTRGVDVNAKAEIHKIISELTKKKLTIIMISSELPELLGMCDRIYVMNSGRIKGSFERNEFSQESILSVALEI